MSDVFRASVTVGDVLDSQPFPEPPHIRKLFMLLHGYYGNPFVSKFASGERDKDGKDKGVLSAMLVWARSLRDFTPSVIEAAANRYKTLYPEFPPNLPQFESVCRSIEPRKTFAEEHGLPALPAPNLKRTGASFNAMGDGKDWARAILAGIEAGDKRTPTVARFAREALGILQPSFVHQ